VRGRRIPSHVPDLARRRMDRADAVAMNTSEDTALGSPQRAESLSCRFPWSPRVCESRLVSRQPEAGFARAQKVGNATQLEALRACRQWRHPRPLPRTATR